MARKTYTEQFKREAVRLVTEERYSNKAAADAVGVCHTTIRDWVARYGDDDAPRTGHASDQDELERLRTENRRLRMERDLLKKATAYFATEEKP